MPHHLEIHTRTELNGSRKIPSADLGASIKYEVTKVFAKRERAGPGCTGHPYKERDIEKNNKY